MTDITVDAPSPFDLAGRAALVTGAVQMVAKAGGSAIAIHADVTDRAPPDAAVARTGSDLGPPGMAGDRSSTLPRCPA